MLVLTRKQNEAIVIGSGIQIRVLETGKRRVKLGVSGPREVPIHREEICDRFESTPEEKEQWHASERKVIF